MGHGGSAAAPLAKEVIEAYFTMAPKAPVVTGGIPPLPDSRSERLREPRL
jgi:penicillin-binding protein 2